MRTPPDDPYGLPQIRHSVEQETASFPGVVSYLVVDFRGDTMMRVEVRREFATEAFEDGLWRWLRKHDAQVIRRVK